MSEIRVIANYVTANEADLYLEASWSGADDEPLVLMGCHQKARKSAKQS